MPEALLYVCGVYNLLFVMLHARFWRLLRWRKQLKKLDRINRGVMQIMNVQLMYVFAVFAALCFGFPHELLSSSLGRFVLGSIIVFWLGRLIEQFVFLRVQNRVVHWLTVGLFIGTVLHSVPLLLGLLAERP
ncbi:hypothetical protein [Solirubrum puertoriconensis]|uniref:Uncharacterized protein n=1 Tax=Solirubrum puertoriconensis TaxID=1751427 RepID=A0A9X0HMP1_SOLP1|nr:hypothetical protein [Solirubrum puertoriconensis]KUG08811.1 hypothetical protein ASU33_11830 [Solirubrum puertoriconensis]